MTHTRPLVDLAADLCQLAALDITKSEAAAVLAEARRFRALVDHLVARHRSMDRTAEGGWTVEDVLAREG